VNRLHSLLNGHREMHAAVEVHWFENREATQFSCQLEDSATFSVSWEIDEDGRPSFQGSFRAKEAAITDMILELTDYITQIEDGPKLEEQSSIRPYTAMRALEEEKEGFVYWMRRVGRVVSGTLTIAGVGVAIGCGVAIAVTAATATPICVGIAVGFLVTGTLADLTQVTHWTDIPEIVVSRGVDVALEFVPGSPGTALKIVKAIASLASLAPQYNVVDNSLNNTIAIENKNLAKNIPANINPCQHHGLIMKITINKDGDQMDVICTNAKEYAAHTVANSDKWCALMLNPHPGTMFGSAPFTERTVVQLARAARQSGFKAIRFNFVGTGRWTDAGDATDVESLINALVAMGECVSGRIVTMGYSYGAAVGAAMLRSDHVAHTIPVAPPYSVMPRITSHFGWYNDLFEEGYTIGGKTGKRAWMVAGKGDGMCTSHVLRDAVTEASILGVEVRAKTLSGTKTASHELVDHFFVGSTTKEYYGDELSTLVKKWLPKIIR